MIRITCSTPGFRRGGVTHPGGTREYPDDHFTKEQLEQLQWEPLLAVEIIEGQSTAPSLGSTPPDPQSKEQRLVAAIGELDPENPDHFTRGNKPQTEALAEIIGEPVSAAERDVAFEASQAAAEQA